MSFKGKVKQLNAWLKTQSIFRGPEEEVGPRKGKQPCESSLSLNKQEYASKSAKQAQESPKEQSEVKSKGKGKGKIQVEQALPIELQNSKERKDSLEQCVQYGKSSDGIQNQGGVRNEPILYKKRDPVKLVAILKLVIDKFWQSLTILSISNRSWLGRFYK
ncbi:hypothetical protein O181_007076 [Austropuccinia psidii MF-1]|uniref:Uncharacterized protein n=1 Tax=Austropuccinia psidii MF-1 TaxID=1389203 RepID=A0A9Q3BM41_9BASI|nr:hypothetical protein [Austropuccinia psidii MF-1]